MNDPIHDTLSFVRIFRNLKPKKDKKSGKPITNAEGKPVMEVTWNLSFNVGALRVQSNVIPEHDPDLFEARFTNDGKTKFLRSKRMMKVRYTDLRAGNTPGRWFTDAVSLEPQATMSAAALDAVLASTPVEGTDDPANDALVDDAELDNTEF